MKTNGHKPAPPAARLPKCPTGIKGLDEITGDDGLSVLPITSLGLNHKVSNERIPTGIPRLDAMLSGRGFFRGSSILLTGTPGTGKTIISACFAHAAARRGERVLFFSFEESPNQIIRNKARGMAHSNQVREFLISDRGIDLVDAYIGPSGVLTGSARAAQTAREKAEALASQQEGARRKRELVRKRAALERQIGGLRSEREAGAEELRRIDEQVGTQTRLLNIGRIELGRLRQTDVSMAASVPRKPKLKNRH